MTDLEKLSLLNLAVSFTAKKSDCRSYLWAVHVQSGSLYAADGHKLIRIMLKNGSFASDDVSYCGDSVRDAVKVKRLELLKVQHCPNVPKLDRVCRFEEHWVRGFAMVNPKLLGDSIRAFEKYSKKPIEIVTYNDNDAPINLSLNDDLAIIDAYIMPIMRPLAKREAA